MDFLLRYSISEIEELSRRELQELCKKLGIRANLKTVVLRKKIQEAQKEAKERNPTIQPEKQQNMQHEKMELNKEEKDLEKEMDVDEVVEEKVKTSTLAVSCLAAEPTETSTVPMTTPEMNTVTSMSTATSNNDLERLEKKTENEDAVVEKTSTQNTKNVGGEYYYIRKVQYGRIYCTRYHS